jgi:hypothetical protein
MARTYSYAVDRKEFRALVILVRLDTTEYTNGVSQVRLKISQKWKRMEGQKDRRTSGGEWRDPEHC